MANQQLVDYIKSQRAAGISMDAIRAQLAQAGWQAADIDDSLKAAEPTVATPAGAAAPHGDIVDKVTKIAQGTISVSDLIPSSQLEMAPATSAKTPSKKEEKKVQSADVSPTASHHLPKLHVSIAVIILTVVSLAFAGGAAYFFTQGKDLREKSAVLRAANDSMTAKIASLTAEVADLTAENTDLKTEVAAMTGENEGFAKNLSFFVAPAGASVAVSVTVKGALSGGGKVLYALMLENGIRLSIVNSKDAKVDAAFKALVSTSSVEISGLHMPGLRDVTVTAVNGASVE